MQKSMKSHVFLQISREKLGVLVQATQNVWSVTVCEIQHMVVCWSTTNVLANAAAHMFSRNTRYQSKCSTTEHFTVVGNEQRQPYAWISRQTT